jgi:PAS domain-containing protein
MERFHSCQEEDGFAPAYVFWSSGGRIHHANQTFCRLLGYSMEELRATSDKDKIRFDILEYVGIFIVVI